MASPAGQSPTLNGESAETYLAELSQGAKRLVQLPLEARRKILALCINGVEHSSRDWLESAWKSKRIPAGDAARAEDILNGPIPTLRYLQLLDRTLADIARFGQPRLPAQPRPNQGRLHVPVFPTRSLCDRLLFPGIQAHVRTRTDTQPDELFGEAISRVSGNAQAPATITLVLGAGNISSIPITDTLTKIFQCNQSVLLKMNPVNAMVGPAFEVAFQPLIQSGLLRIVYGDGRLGQQLIASRGIQCVHITGSDRTHDAIVWGSENNEHIARKEENRPLLDKPITSELGNVSPWIIVPGKYTQRQLQFQAEHIAASMTNNAAFNCVATRMLITQRGWPQREQLLRRIESILAELPRRYAYYPGAAQRFVRFAGFTPDNLEYLPWTLRRDVDPQQEPQLFQEESFTCVCGEMSLEANSPIEFLSRAVDFANHRMWGTLSAALTVPQDFQRRCESELNAAVDALQYGIVGINQWPGVAFALMSTPWGAFPGSTLNNIQSGIGTVHNTYLLDPIEKTVITSPLKTFPKPVWFSSHRRPEAVAQRLMQFYAAPRLTKLLPILWHALRG
ncbi:MAG: aldehyde dehydrogenase family protein [bacterium]|nr:aldehyde dehydrogenase family protein [bacterium]